AIIRTACCALLDDAREVEGRVGVALEVAPAIVRAAEACFEQQPVRDRGGPGSLWYAQRLGLADANGFRRNTRRIGDARGRTRAGAADNLLVPETAQFVARRDLPGHAAVDVFPRAVRVLGLRRVRRIQPRVRVARVQVGIHTGSDTRTALLPPA